MTIPDLRALAGNANVSAFLRVIRAKESGQEDSAYFMRWPGKTFSDLSAHPNILEPIPGSTLKSSAAGAYQIVGTTWRALQAQYGFTDFSRDSQDCAAVALIAGRGALQDVIAGRLEAAVAKCRPEWTSLPGAAESRASWTMDKARAVFVQYGGKFTLHEQPAKVNESAPPKLRQRKDAPMGALGAGLVGQLLQTVIGAFAPLARDKIAREVGRLDPAAGESVADALMGVVKEVTGQADPVQAVAAVTAGTPEAQAKLATVQEDSLAYLDKLAPMLDKIDGYERAAWADSEASYKAAAERAANPATNIQPVLISYTQWMLGAACASVAALLGIQAWKGGPLSSELTTLLVVVVTALVATYRTQNDYGFGSSRSSAAKDVVISNLSGKQ